MATNRAARQSHSMHLASLALVAVGVLTPGLVFAQPSPPGRTVSFDEALALAVDAPTTTPTRRALGERRRSDRGLGGTLGQTTIQVMPGATLSPDAAFELQVSATQSWNLADLGAVRRRAAARERQVLGAQLRLEALRARLEAARRWIDLHTLQSVTALLAQHRELQEARISLGERAMERGAGGVMEVVEAQAALAALDARRLEIEGQRFVAEARLAFAMGRTSHLRAAGALPTPSLPDLQSVGQRLEDLDRLPDVAVRRLAVDAARAREVEAAAQYAPSLSIGAQFEHSGPETWVLYGVAGLTFSAFGSERRAVSRARAASARGEASLDVARLTARRDIEEVLHDVDHDRRRVRALEEIALPTLRRMLDQRERLVSMGEATAFVLFEAQQRVLAGEEALVRARAASTWSEIRLWLILAELSPTGGDRGAVR